MLKFTVTVADPDGYVGPEEVNVVLWLLGKRGSYSYHVKSPMLLAHRIRHRLTGPQRGCSCSRCFHDPRRRVPAREVYELRVRVHKLESTLREAGIKIPYGR